MTASSEHRRPPPARPSDLTEVVQELHKLLKKATPRPWATRFYPTQMGGDHYVVLGGGTLADGSEVPVCRAELYAAHPATLRANAHLIAASINHLSILLTAFARQQAALEKIVELHATFWNRPEITWQEYRRQTGNLASTALGLPTGQTS